MPHCVLSTRSVVSGHHAVRFWIALAESQWNVHFRKLAHLLWQAGSRYVLNLKYSLILLLWIYPKTIVKDTHQYLCTTTFIKTFKAVRVKTARVSPQRAFCGPQPAGSPFAASCPCLAIAEGSRRRCRIWRKRGARTSEELSVWGVTLHHYVCLVSKEPMENGELGVPQEDLARELCRHKGSYLRWLCKDIGKVLNNPNICVMIWTFPPTPSPDTVSLNRLWN